MQSSYTRLLAHDSTDVIIQNLQHDIYHNGTPVKENVSERKVYTIKGSPIDNINQIK